MAGSDTRDLLIVLFFCVLTGTVFFLVYNSGIVFNGLTLRQWAREWDSFLTGGVF